MGLLGRPEKSCRRGGTERWLSLPFPKSICLHFPRRTRCGGPTGGALGTTRMGALLAQQSFPILSDGSTLPAGTCDRQPLAPVG